MDPAFWHERWADGRTGWHESNANALLLRHFQALNLAHGARLFVPLCGKSVDLLWLRDQGCSVVGAELDQSAVDAFFTESGLAADIRDTGPLKHYSAHNIDVFAGDIFDLTARDIGPVDAVYDRAALVALPDAMRARYARHLGNLTNQAPQLLVTFDYDQSQTDGPPFSVSNAMIDALYGATYRRATLERQDITGGLAERAEGFEIASLLLPLTDPA